VYKNTPRTIEHLKDAIRQEIQDVNVDTSGKVFQNLEKSIQVCLDVKGDHFTAYTIRVMYNMHKPRGDVEISSLSFACIC